MIHVFNATNLRVGGGLQVAQSLLEEDSLSDQPIFGHVIMSPELYSFIPEQLKTRLAEKTSVRTGRMVRFGVNITAIKLQKKYGNCCIFTVFGPSGIFVDKLFKNICHIQGFANPWLTAPGKKYIKDNRLWRKWIRSIVQLMNFAIESRVIVVESEAVKEDLESIWLLRLKRIVVARNGAARRTSDRIVRVDRGNTTPVGYFPSAGYAHKNHDALPVICKEYFDRYGARMTVKVTLTDKEYAGLEARYNGAETHLINVGRLNAVQSSEEFRNSDFCLVPSLVECSSAVIYEAIEHDCPIVATDFRFNREIGKAAASYFKPKEYTAAAKLIHKQLYGPDVRQRSTELRHELREIYSRNAEIRYKIIHEILNNHTYHN